MSSLAGIVGVAEAGGLVPGALTLAAGGMAPEAQALVVVLLAAAVVALVFSRLRLSVIPAYLITGVLIGPHTLGLLADADAATAINELALILLMFGIGLHLDLTSFRGALGPLTAIGAASTVAGAALVGAMFSLFMPWYAAAALGLALASSSTAVVLRILQSRRQLAQPAGRVSFAVLIVQDLLVVPMLAAIPLLAKAAGIEPDSIADTMAGTTDPGDLPRWLDTLLAGLTALSLTVLLLVGGKLALPRLLNEAARARSDEVMLMVAAAVAVGAAVATALLGFSPALGSFVAGFLLSSTPFRYQLSGQLSALRDLFMAVFFVSVGLAIDPLALARDAWIILLALGGVLSIKAFTIAACGWLWGASARVAAITGLYLCQAGEFSLVVLSAASVSGVLDARLYGLGVAIVILSLIITPTIVNIAPRVGDRAAGLPRPPWLARTRFGREGAAAEDSDGPSTPEPRRVVVAGFGPVGRAVAERLAQRGVHVTIIELNAQTVQKQQALGRRAVFGDASNPEVLESAGITEAAAAVITIPDDEAMLRACRAIRALRPDLYIAARSNYLSRGMQARAMGASLVVVEEVAAAEAMAAQVVQHLARENERPQAGAADSPAPAPAPGDSAGTSQDESAGSLTQLPPRPPDDESPRPTDAPFSDPDGSGAARG